MADVTTAAMTEADPDAIGPAGSVRLRGYLSTQDSVWFTVFCDSPAGCSHAAPLGIRAAIRIRGPAEATVRQLETRLRCSRCGGRRVSIVVAHDTRPPIVRGRDGPAPQTQAGLPD